jgi:FK506-binding nuclear protein
LNQMAKCLTVRLVTHPPTINHLLTSFAANKSGKPFSFKLGSGEVIQGWDIGIAGMAVGGERRITIPAKLGYASKSMPGIPANSNLVFDVKLLSIH